jgi:DNA-binding IclR family transcriptional regulator
MMRAEKTPSVPALVRGLAILERVARSRRGLTFAQLTRHFDFPKSSVHTLLVTFEREGYLVRDDETGRYVAGAKLVNIANMTLDGVVLREKAAPLLHDLARDTGLTAHLAVLDHDEVILVAKVDRPGPQRVATWVGKRMDVHCTSLGKCLIAHLPEDEPDRIIRERGLLRHNENTIVRLYDSRTIWLVRVRWATPWTIRKRRLAAAASARRCGTGRGRSLQQ